MIYREYGGPEELQLEEIEHPVPAPMDLLIDVAYATVNRTDCAMLRAQPWIMRLLTGLTKPRKSTLGTVFAGTVRRVGKSTFARCRRLLKSQGTYISSELGPGAQNGFYALGSRLSFGRKVRFPFPGTTKDSLRLTAKMLQTGSLVPVVERTYPLHQLADAFTLVESQQKVGNVLLSIVPDLE